MDIILNYLINLTQINTFLLTLLIIVAFTCFNIFAKVIIENLHESYNSREASEKIIRIYFNYIYTSISVIIIIFNMFLLTIKFESIIIGGIITLAETGLFMLIVQLIFKKLIEITECEVKNWIFGIIGILLEFIF